MNSKKNGKKNSAPSKGKYLVRTKILPWLGESLKLRQQQRRRREGGGGGCFKQKGEKDSGQG